MTWFDSLFSRDKHDTNDTDVEKKLEMMTRDITQSYFSEEELKCKCGCSSCNMDGEFLYKLNKARHKDGKPWKVNSAYRCTKHNASVGGKKNSAHVHGCAVDIHAPTSARKFEIVTAALSVGFNRIGIGKNFVHLDSDTSAGHPANVLWTY